MDTIHQRFPQYDEGGQALIDKAYAIASAALADETRGNGHPFIEHPVNVALIAADEIGLPADCVAAVFLHEATRKHPEIDLRAERPLDGTALRQAQGPESKDQGPEPKGGFPEDVYKMVDGLNKIATIKPKDTRLEAESYKKLIVQYSTDPRVTVLKIADRLEVMRNLSAFPKSSRDQKLLETIMLYMPLAHQLGLYNINTELGDIYFKYAFPEEFRTITNKLKATEKDREQLTAEFIRPLEARLSEAGIHYKLKTRTKSAYSIYRKMQAQKVPFEGVYDVFAIRFIIDCEEDPKAEKDLCWKVYSYVTEEYEPDVSRLRNWLTTPRSNGYESLHITVKNKLGQFVEVQIRTKRMDIDAEMGSAAHWAYKGIHHEAAIDRWLQTVRESLENQVAVKPEEMPAPLSKDVFVFTPTGELRILQAGSSVLDFAFNIHSGIGCKCSGGKVNGKPVQIKEKLHTGDVVEIMTSRNQRPSRDWLNWVVTSKGRTRIRQEIDADERKAAVEGREILERRLKNWKLELTDDMLVEYMKSVKYSSVLQFLASVAREETDVNDVKAFILQKQASKEERTVEISENAADIPARGYSGGKPDDILVLNAKNIKGIDR